MQRKTLSQIFGPAPFAPPSVIGIVDVVVRNADGDVALDADGKPMIYHKRNMTTDHLRYSMAINNLDMTATRIFINENSQPMHPKRTAMRTYLPGIWKMDVSASKDGPNRLWSYSTVFAAPPNNRIFQTVGLARNAETGPFTNFFGGPQNIQAATVLSAPVTQLTTQTLEVTYRLAFQRS